MPLTLAGAAMVGQAALGIGQTLYGALKKKPEIPQVEIPQQLYQNMSDAEYWSFVGMPEDQKQKYLDDLKGSSATAMSRISDRRGGLGAIAGLHRSESEGLRDIAVADTQMRMQNLQKLAERRSQFAEAKLGVDQINRETEMIKRQELMSMQGAGLQNIMGAMGSIGTLSSMFGSDSIYSKGTKTPTTTTPSTTPTTTTANMPKASGSGMGSVWQEKQFMNSLF